MSGQTWHAPSARLPANNSAEPEPNYEGLGVQIGCRCPHPAMMFGALSPKSEGWPKDFHHMAANFGSTNSSRGAARAQRAARGVPHELILLPAAIPPGGNGTAGPAATRDGSAPAARLHGNYAPAGHRYREPLGFHDLDPHQGICGWPLYGHASSRAKGFATSGRDRTAVTPPKAPVLAIIFACRKGIPFG